MLTDLLASATVLHMTNTEIHPVPSDHPVADHPVADLPPAAFVALEQRSFIFSMKADADEFWLVLEALHPYLDSASVAVGFESGQLVGTPSGNLSVTVSDAEGWAEDIAGLLGRVLERINEG